MSDGLKEKLERWLPQIPEMALPVHLAAAALGMKRQIEKEDWGNAQSLKDIAFTALDAIAMNAYLMHGLKSGKPNKFALKVALNELTQTPEYAALNPLERQKIFNRISTRDRHDFNSRAKALAKNSGNTYRLLLDRALGTIRFMGERNPILDSVDKQIKLVGTMLSGAESPLYIEDMKQAATPQDGPKTIPELIACVQTYVSMYNVRSQNSEIFTTQDSPSPEHVNQAVLLLAGHLERMQADLPESSMRAEIRENYEVIGKILKTRFITPFDLVALTHFYLEHSEDKLNPSDYAALHEAMSFIQINSYLEQNAEKIENLGVKPESALRAFEELSQKLFVDYQKPSAHETAENMIAAMRAAYQGNPRSVEKNIRGFEEARASLPEGMEEVVLLHYEESEQIRELRKKLFKAQKEKFIKTLAVENAEELEAIGLTAEQIAGMGETGKIPDGSGLTVEHIIDRHHGGTNQLHNFILMPREINEAKNELKRYQTNAAQDADRGCWIISWVPKKNADGTYPKIFNPGRQDGFPQPDQPEFEKLEV